MSKNVLVWEKNSVGTARGWASKNNGMFFIHPKGRVQFCVNDYNFELGIFQNVEEAKKACENLKASDLIRMEKE